MGCGAVSNGGPVIPPTSVAGASSDPATTDTTALAGAAGQAATGVETVAAPLGGPVDAAASQALAGTDINGLIEQILALLKDLESATGGATAGASGDAPALGGPVQQEDPLQKGGEPEQGAIAGAGGEGEEACDMPGMGGEPVKGEIIQAPPGGPGQEPPVEPSHGHTTQTGSTTTTTTQTTQTSGGGFHFRAGGPGGGVSFGTGGEGGFQFRAGGEGGGVSFGFGG